MNKFLVFLGASLTAFAAILLLSRPVAAEANPQQDIVAHGRYIAIIAGCTDCHTPYKANFQNPQKLTPELIQTIAFRGNEAADTNKFMAGGRAFDLGPAGIVYSRNLTPDKETGIGNWTDEQIKLAIKTGADLNGEVLFPVMPYHIYNGMADSDLDAVIAFLHSLTPIKNQTPKDTVSKEGLQVLPLPKEIIAPDPSDKAARGAYLVNYVAGCTDCHTPIDQNTGAPLMDKYLAGGQPYEGPWGLVYGGNITSDPETGIGSWSEAEIKHSLLTGVKNDGRRLILMPYFAYANLTSEDADAIVYFLKNELPAVKNEIPALSLNPGFEVMDTTPQSLPQGGPFDFSLPYIIAVGLIILFAAYILYRRRAS